MKDCVFCKIVKGELPCHKVWEDKNHLAFLSIFPNTDGVTVVIPKKHYSSYAFEVPDKVLADLIKATKKVGGILDKAFDDVGRTGLVLEGFGVNHLHAKLYPLHGTKTDKWREWRSNSIKFFEKYDGYISSNDGPRVDDKKLEKLAKKIRGEK